MWIYSITKANITPIEPLTGHQYIRIQNSLNYSDSEVWSPTAYLIYWLISKNKNLKSVVKAQVTRQANNQPQKMIEITFMIRHE